MSAGATVDVEVASAAASIPDEDTIRSWIDAVFEVLPQGTPCEVSICIVDEDRGRRLNADFRGQDKATNVLSFPAGTDAPSPPAGCPRLLGDIVICGPVVEREAARQGKNVDDHWGHLLVHGMLHLLGYDHEVSEDAEAMEALERQVLGMRGVEDPYAL